MTEGYQKYLYGQLISVFMSLLDEKEKRKPHIIKLNDAIRRVHLKPMVNNDKDYYKSADIIGEAMKKSWSDIPDGKDITINAICWMIFNRHEKNLKQYKFNRKHFEKMSIQGVSGYALESAKVLNLIEKYIKDSE